MSPAVLHLLATERHVESALATGHIARTWRSFLGKMASCSGLAPATPEMTRLATQSVLDSSRQGLGWEGVHAVVGAVDDALGVLRRAGVDPEMLRRASGNRARWLATLLASTDDLLRRAGRFDDRALGWVAAQSIDDAPDDEWPQRIVIEGLVEWNASDFAWVEALARRVAVTVRMPRVVGATGVASAPDALLSALEDRWQLLPRAPDLELVELAISDEVRLIEAPSDDAEAKAIVRVVLDALEAGTSAEDIAIVVPALDEIFLEPLRAAFDEARIPYSEPRGRPPVASPAVRAALGWLDLAAGPLHRDQLIDLLRMSVVDPAPFIDDPTFALRKRRALSLARRMATLPVGTDPDGHLLRDVLAASLSDATEDRWMLDATDRIVRARDDLRADAPRDAMTAKLTALWRALGLWDGFRESMGMFLRAAPASREATLLAAELRERAVGLEALVTACERVSDAARVLSADAMPVSPARFRVELEQALTGVAPLGTRRGGTVRVVRVSEVAGLPTELLIVARASEGTFETFASRNPLLGEDIVAALAPARRPLLFRELVAAGRTQLMAAIGSARRWVLSRSRADSDGRAVAPAALFHELSRGRKPEAAPASPLDRCARPLSSRGAELICLSRGLPSRDEDVGRRAAIEKERLAFFLDPRRRASTATGAVETNEDAVREHLRDAFGGTSGRPMAATEIERAALCRFAAFAGRVLGASSGDSVGEGLEPRQRGSIVHRALELALEAMRSRWNELGRLELMSIGLEAARRVFVHEKTSPLYRAEIERALRDVAAVLEWSLDDDSGFRFAYGERTFGESARATKTRPASRDAPWPPLVIGSGSHTIFVKGRIDRIDFSADGGKARVIDYKTGALPAWKDVGTLLFQPPLYAYALLLRMGRLSVPEIRALYLETSRRPPRTLPSGKGDGEGQIISLELMTAAQRRAVELVSQLWMGDVAPRPADAAVCSRCDVRDVCRRPAAMPIEEPELEGDGSTS